MAGVPDIEKYFGVFHGLPGHIFVGHALQQGHPPGRKFHVGRHVFFAPVWFGRQVRRVGFHQQILDGNLGGDFGGFSVIFVGHGAGDGQGRPQLHVLTAQFQAAAEAVEQHTGVFFFRAIRSFPLRKPAAAFFAECAFLLQNIHGLLVGIT